MAEVDDDEALNVDEPVVSDEPVLNEQSTSASSRQKGKIKVSLSRLWSTFLLAIYFYFLPLHKLKCFLLQRKPAITFESELIAQSNRREIREIRLLEIAERNQVIAEQELLRIRAKDNRLLEIAERQLVLAEEKEMRKSTQYII